MSEPIIKILVDVADLQRLLAFCESSEVENEIADKYQPMIDRARRAR